MPRPARANSMNSASIFGRTWWLGSSSGDLLLPIFPNSDYESGSKRPSRFLRLLSWPIIRGRFSKRELSPFHQLEPSGAPRSTVVCSLYFRGTHCLMGTSEQSGLLRPSYIAPRFLISPLQMANLHDFGRSLVQRLETVTANAFAKHQIGTTC